MVNSIVPYESKPPAIPSESTVASLMLLAKQAVLSGMAKTKNQADAFFIICYGLELGVAPMTALRTIYSVNGGAPTCSGELMLALIRRSGRVNVRISSTEETMKAEKATVYMKRLDSGDEFTAVWGKEDDTRAGLTSNRAKYPAQMWTWRAVSIAAKALCSDIVGGLYTVEEIYPRTVLDENGEPVGDIIPGDLMPAPAEREQAKKTADAFLKDIQPVEFKTAPPAAPPAPQSVQNMFDDLGTGKAPETPEKPQYGVTTGKDAPNWTGPQWEAFRKLLRPHFPDYNRMQLFIERGAGKRFKPGEQSPDEAFKGLGLKTAELNPE